MKRGNGFTCMEFIHWSYQVLHSPEAISIKKDGMVFEHSVTGPARWRYLAGLRQGYSEGSLCSESASTIRCYFFHSQHSWSRNKGVEMGVAFLTITPCDPLAKFLPPVFMTLCSVGLNVLVPERRMFTPRHDFTPLNCKLVTWTLWAPHVPLSHRQRRE